jgi:hypothetical protein
VNVLSSNVKLVRRRHVLVEDVAGNCGEGGVSDPSTVVAGTHLSELVSAHLRHGSLVGGRVVLDGDLSGHSAHGVDASAMTGLDEKLDVGVHEGSGHGDGASVGEDEVGVVSEAFDDAEDVIPTTAVETGRVFTEFVDNLYLISG